jgi:autotransporter-associated beta strand protein
MLTATNNSFSGGITVNAGTLQIGDGAADGSLGTGPLMINGGTLTFNTALPVNSTGEITDNSALTIAGTGSTLLSGNIHDNGTINITGPANVLLSGIIDGVGVLTNYSGTVTLTSSNFYVGTSGTVTLSAPNTYSGGTMIRGAGILRATASSALGTGTCFIGGAQTDTSRLELSDGIVLNNPISIFPRIFFGTASGTTDVAADILNVSGTNTLSPPSSIVIASGGNNLTLQSDSGDLILTTGVTGGGSGRHLVLRGAGSGEIQGALDRTGSNSQNVWKLDSGSWTLWGANSPGAATTISNGVLVLNGSLDNVLTNAGGTLAGTGVLSGPVYINAGATLAPGPSIGTMTVNNMLTLQPGSFTSMDVNKSTGASDRVVGLTNVTFGGTLVLNNLSGTLAAGDAFKLFDSTSYSGGFASISPFTPGAGLVWDTSTLAVDGTLRIKVGSVSQPTISSWAYTGSALVMSGSNGLPNASYSVVASTNVTAPLANWSVSGSGSFDASGNFSVTNPVSSSTPRMFFRLRVP